MSAVFSLFPRAGLGNKLFAWARGAVFAQINDLPHYTLGWSHFALRAKLRGEGRRSLYGGSFRRGYRSYLQSWRLAGPIVREPPLREAPKGTYVFDQIPSWRDYFGDLRTHRETVRQRFFLAYRGTRPAPEAPFIALHVRLGDFRPPDARPFAEQGSVRTPTDYFLEAAGAIRGMIGYDAPIRIFSDGRDGDLADLLALPNSTRHRARSDAEDMVRMSQAGVIVTSAGSTFSLWAGFLGDGVLIHHPDHFHQPVRAPSENWEGPWPGCTDPLRQSLQRLF